MSSAPTPAAALSTSRTTVAALPLPRAEGPAAALAGLFLLSVTGHTRKAYATDLRDFYAWCAATGVDPLAARRGHVELYVEGLRAARRAPSTIARRLAALAGLYGYAVDEGLLPASPVAHVRRPRLGADSPTLGLSREQLAALLAAAAAAGPRDLALACLLGLNGLRVGELVPADVDDLGHERGHRVLRLTRDRAARALRRLARRADLPTGLSPHSLRHTFVTLALDAGASLRDVQDGAGHADPRTTRRYDRGRHSLDRHVTYTIAGYLAGSST